ncbi:hypothetical protein LCGC14_1002010 [marine sediment metagenome]|uniref:Uncharacterized protein n=1 Tax=marine sediment metagenome TaxID=412755 RepID=A0A0F9N2U3_9ZZZZ
MPNYPGSLDDDVSLFLAVNNARTRLTSGISISDLTIPVVTTSGFPNQGFVTILSNPDDITEAEAIAYTGFTETSFSGTGRGAGGTPIFAHAVGNNVDLTVMAEHHNELKDAVITLEQVVGISGSHNFVPKDAQGNVIISGTLTVSGTSSLEGNVDTFGNLTASGDLTASGNLTVSGISVLRGNVDTFGNLTAVGNLTISGTSSLAGEVDMKDTLTVSGVAAFGQAPIATSIASLGNFDDSTGTTTSTTFTSVLTSDALGTGNTLLLYRGNVGLDPVSVGTAGLLSIQAKLSGSEIGLGEGDNSEKFGHQQSAEIAGFKVVDAAGAAVDILVKGDAASVKTVQYGALGVVSVPLDRNNLVEDTDYWFDNGSDTEVLIDTGDNGIVTRTTFNFTVPSDGDYLILLSLEARGTREVRVNFRLDGITMVKLQEIGNNEPSPFPAAVLRNLTAGPHTLLHQQGHDNTANASSAYNRMRFFVVSAAAFENIQSIEDSDPVVTAASTFTHLSAFEQTFVPLTQQQVLVLGIGGYNTVNTSTNVTAASYKLVNSTDAADYSLDSGMQIYNQGSGASHHATLMFRLLDDVATAKTLQMHFRNSSGDAQSVEHNEGSLIVWGLAAPPIIADIPLTTVDGNDVTTHSINSDLVITRNMTVSEDVTISGALTGGLLTVASGIFSDSLTISGVPVSINVPSFDPTADETISGDWDFSSSLTVSGIPVATGTGSALTVRETDGTPTVLNVNTIVVTTGTLTDDGDGQVTITTGGGGGGAGTITDINTSATGPSVTITGTGAVNTDTVGNIITINSPALDFLALNVPFRGARVSLVGVQTISSGNTQITFDQTDFDTDGFVVGGDESELVIPAGVTKVRLRAMWWWVDTEDGNRQISIRNITAGFPGSNAGSGVRQDVNEVGDTVAGGAATQQAFTSVRDVTAGDKFALLVSQSSGGTIDNLTSATVNYLEIEVLETTDLLQIGEFTSVSGTFTESLTISGVPVSTGTGGATDHGALTGLSDNDHPQYGQLADPESAAGVWDFSTGLTVSGIPVSTETGDALTVRETDSSPTVNNVTTIVVTTGTLTDDGGGQVTINTGGGGGSGGTALTVQEVDGDPSVANVDTIVVTNGTLTDDGSGQVTISTGGSGGGGGLGQVASSGTIWMPEVAPASGTRFDDEFVQGTAASGTESIWTLWDPGDNQTIFENDESGLRIRSATAGEWLGIFQDVPADGATGKWVAWSYVFMGALGDLSGSRKVGIALFDNASGAPTTTDFQFFGLTSSSSNDWSIERGGYTGYTDITPSPVDRDQAFLNGLHLNGVFLRVIKTNDGVADHTWEMAYSFDGVGWKSLAPSDPGFNVAQVGIICQNNSGTTLYRYGAKFFRIDDRYNGAGIRTATMRGNWLDPTGGGGGASTLQEAYDNGDGIITTAGGKPLELDGTGELLAVTGTFTQSLIVDGISVLPSISFSGALVTTSGWDTVGTNGIVSWSGAHYNVGNWWNISEGTRFTVPAGVNYIRSDSQFHLLTKTSNPPANKVFGATLFQNGSVTQPQVKVKHIWDQGVTNAQSMIYQMTSPAMPVNEGDYFELQVDDNTNDADVLASRTYFSIEKVG